MQQPLCMSSWSSLTIPRCRGTELGVNGVENLLER